MWSKLTTGQRQASKTERKWHYIALNLVAFSADLFHRKIGRQLKSMRSQKNHLVENVRIDEDYVCSENHLQIHKIGTGIQLFVNGFAAS